MNHFPLSQLYLFFKSYLLIISLVANPFLSCTFSKNTIPSKWSHSCCTSLAVKPFTCFTILNDDEKVKVLDYELEFLDIISKSDKQYGFKTILNNGKSLVFAGDEPLYENLYELSICICKFSGK